MMMMLLSLPQGAAGWVSAAEVEARRGRSFTPAAGVGSWFTGWSARRRAPSWGSSPPTAQDPPGDANADSGGPQQATGVPAAQTQRTTAAGQLTDADIPWKWGVCPQRVPTCEPAQIIVIETMKEWCVGSCMDMLPLHREEHERVNQGLLCWIL